MISWIYSYKTNNNNQFWPTLTMKDCYLFFSKLKNPTCPYTLGLPYHLGYFWDTMWLVLMSQRQTLKAFGVSDERMGEELCAWIKLNTGCSLNEEEVRQFCKGKISQFKIPKYISFVTEFPTTVTGKIQKFIMKETMGKRLKHENSWY